MSNRSYLLLAGLAVSGGCDLLSKDPDTELQRFNGDDPPLVVCVGDPPAGSCEPVGAVTLASAGGTEVGTAIVDPATGPVGTVHALTVDIDDTWAEDITLVRGVFSSDRGEQRLSLRQDPADHAHWFLDITTLGAPDEVREDTIAIEVYETVEIATTTTSTTTTPSDTP